MRGRRLRDISKRVVITGVGPVTSVGIGKEPYWESLVKGRSGSKRINFHGFDMDQYNTKIAAPIEHFNLSDYVIETKRSKHLGRTSRFAIAGTMLALKDADLRVELNEERSKEGQYYLGELDSFKVGVILGIGVENMDLMEMYHEKFIEHRGPKRLSPFGLPHIYMSSIASNVADRFGLRGSTYTVSSACASGTHAIINAYRQIQGGAEDIVATGGVDACITPYVFGGFVALRAMSTRNDDPMGASRPFDAQRDGFVMAEGSGILILERLEHALARNASIYAELIGYGMTADAYHITEPDPQGRSLIRAIKLALKSAGLSPREINYINPHGTSTLLNDAVETLAIKKAMGKWAYHIPISSTKSITGHTMGAAGGVETVATALTIQREMIHPTINYEFPDPECDLDYVPNEPRRVAVKTAMSISAGFGGVNSVIIMRQFEGI
ncbi:MAG: beta-ketoacyl-[acyl-carrier-protein] synthase family protein [Syntrophobacterales bacterium]|nr:MAG: beta-ketoacyl-[acyl-carrier-protein] synthase family protein [Syntrophobacterales bacterium]